MLIKLVQVVLLFTITTTLVVAQDDPLKRAKKRDIVDPEIQQKIEPARRDSILQREYELSALNASKPTVGLGTGILSFYGEVSNKKFANMQVSRPAYELNIAQNLNDYLNLKFYVLFGKLGADERTSARNLNFESQIRLGGATLTYNFDQLLPAQRKITPYIFLGIETFEFLSKTDLTDKNADTYHYWTDGSIHNLEETHPLASQSKLLVRDYTYESDLREANIDGLGKYRERSMAIPVGAGVIFKLSDRVDFKLATSIHFSQTDNIDNVNKMGVGVRQGDKKNDRFVMTCFSLNYDLVGPQKKEKPVLEKDSVDNYLALDNADEDSDGVTDPNDFSPFTPKGVAVDTAGVPLDEDGDLASDFFDKELGSAKGAITDTKGVTYTEQTMEEEWLRFIDSTNAYAMKVNLNDPTEVAASLDPKMRILSYSVFLGSFKNKVPTELINKYLSIDDIFVIKNPEDSTNMYLAGKYKTYEEAISRNRKVNGLGIPDAVVVFKNRKGKYLKATAPVNEGEVDESKYIIDFSTNNNTNNNVNNQNSNNNNTNKNNNTNNTNSNNNNQNSNSNNNNTNTANTNPKDTNSTSAANNVGQPNNENVNYRVQVGAYKNKTAKADAFNNVPNLLILTGEDNVSRYLSGSFKTYKEALDWRYELYILGYKDAFVTAYRTGQRVTLQSTGAALEAPPENGNGYPFINDANKESNGIDKKAISFKIQLGVFKGVVPNDLLQQYISLGKIEQEKTNEGLTRYTVGQYPNFEQAEKQKNEIIKKGINGAFVVAFFNDRLIDLQEAKELLK